MTPHIPVLVAFFNEGDIRLITYPSREAAETDIEELNALTTAHSLAHVSAEILSPAERAGPLVDEFADDVHLADRLERLGYTRTSGLWCRASESGRGLTLPDAIKDAQTRGLWEA